MTRTILCAVIGSQLSEQLNWVGMDPRPGQAGKTGFRQYIIATAIKRKCSYKSNVSIHRVRVSIQFKFMNCITTIE